MIDLLLFLIIIIMAFSFVLCPLFLLGNGAHQPVEPRLEPLALDGAGLVDGPRAPLQLRQLRTRQEKK